MITATHRDLPALIADGMFRSDLFYRINVFPIEIPPLRERKEDIRLLVEYFIDRYFQQSGKKDTAHRQEESGPAAGLSVAGQHSRAAECNRAFGDRMRHGKFLGR